MPTIRVLHIIQTCVAATGLTLLNQMHGVEARDLVIIQSRHSVNRFSHGYVFGILVVASMGGGGGGGVIQGQGGAGGVWMLWMQFLGLVLACWGRCWDESAKS